MLHIADIQMRTESEMIQHPTTESYKRLGVVTCNWLSHQCSGSFSSRVSRACCSIAIVNDVAVPVAEEAVSLRQLTTVNSVRWEYIMSSTMNRIHGYASGDAVTPMLWRGRR